MFRNLTIGTLLLAAATIARADGSFVSDEFEGDVLGPHWRTEFAGPLGTSSFSVRNGRLEVMAGPGASLTGCPTQAPFIYQGDISDGNLDVTALAVALDPSVHGQQAGLMVRRDGRNWLGIFLGFAADGEVPVEVRALAAEEGRLSVLAAGRAGSAGGTVFFRIARRDGTAWSLEYADAGHVWTSLGRVSRDLGGSPQVGLSVGAADNGLSFAAAFESVRAEIPRLFTAWSSWCDPSATTFEPDPAGGWSAPVSKARVYRASGFSGGGMADPVLQAEAVVYGETSAPLAGDTFGIRFLYGGQPVGAANFAPLGGDAADANGNVCRVGPYRIDVTQAIPWSLALLDDPAFSAELFTVQDGAEEETASLRVLGVGLSFRLGACAPGGAGGTAPLAR
jgi:hypothetical protein